MILVVWVALIVLTTFYCYFCEQRLFPANKQKRLQESQYSSSEGGPAQDTPAENDNDSKGNLLANMTAIIPKDNLRSRKEVRQKLRKRKKSCLQNNHLGLKTQIFIFQTRIIFFQRLASACSCNSVSTTSTTTSSSPVGAYKRF